MYGLPKLEAWIKVDETPEHQLFVANPYYYKVDTAGQQLPYIDEVEEVYAAENELFELKIINGEIQYKAQSLQIGSLPLFQQNQDKGNYDIQMAQGAGNGRTYVFNATHKDPVLAELFSDPRWNRAMSLALNRMRSTRPVFRPVRAHPGRACPPNGIVRQARMVHQRHRV